MSEPELERLLRFDPQWEHEMRVQWLRIIDLATFGGLTTSNPLALSRLRKRLLDLGERWRALLTDRTWIPQPRERLKNALGATLALRDALSATENVAREITGGRDSTEFKQRLAEMRATVDGTLRERETAWAELLERINRDALDT